MATNVPFGITGSTGQMGGRVARYLAERGFPQRLIVRDPTRAPRLPGAEVVQAQYRDGPAMQRALEGVQTLFLVSGSESADRVHEHTTAIDAAVAAGVGRIVYLSFLAAAPDATFTFARDHYHTEQHIRSSGPAYSFVRAGLYLDYIPLMAWDDGAIRGPGGNGRVAWIGRDDLAEVVEVVLTDAGHNGKTYDVTGPEAITLHETAGYLAQVTGRPIRYEEETPEEARASRAGFGAPDWEVEGWVTTYTAVASGELEVVSDTVLRLTGHPPQTVPAYLRRHPELWTHLTEAS